MTDQKKPSDFLADQALDRLQKVARVVRSIIGDAFFINWLEAQGLASRKSLDQQLKAAGMEEHSSMLLPVLDTSNVGTLEGDAWAEFYRSELERITALKGQELMGAAAMAAQALKATMDKNSLTIRQAGLHQAEERATH